MPPCSEFAKAANRLSCGNHLKQLGLALLHQHDTYGVLPSNGGWDRQQWILSVDGRHTYVSTKDASVSITFYWGVGDPNRSPQGQTGSWAYAVLPFLEQDNMYRGRAWTVPLQLYVCPTRRPVQAQEAVNDQYGTYQGGGWVWGKTDYAANALLVPNRPRCFRLADVTDGTSHTVLLGEKAMNPLNYSTGTWYWDEPFFTGGSGGTQRGSGLAPSDGTAVVRRFPGYGLCLSVQLGIAASGRGPVSVCRWIGPPPYLRDAGQHRSRAADTEWRRRGCRVLNMPNTLRAGHHEQQRHHRNRIRTAFAVRHCSCL